MSGRYAIANWKMNLPPEGLEKYVRTVGGSDRGAATVVLAPPYPYLREVSRVASGGVQIAGQNCADHDHGAFTGEVAVPMLRDCGAKFVIVGHSERRQIYGETDALIARKLAIAHSGGLTPVLCIGEDLRTRDLGKVSIFLADQIRAASAGNLEQASEIVVAYEPIWAIGTGRNASGLMVAETVEHIREALRRFWPERLAGAPILYGGSVTPENVGDLVTHGRIDGFLVGGASLDSTKFLAIERALNNP